MINMKTKKQINKYLNEIKTQIGYNSDSPEAEVDLEIDIRTIEWVLKQTEEGNKRLEIALESLDEIKKRLDKLRN